MVLTADTSRHQYTQQNAATHTYNTVRRVTCSSCICGACIMLRLQFVSHISFATVSLCHMFIIAAKIQYKATDQNSFNSFRTKPFSEWLSRVSLS